MVLTDTEKQEMSLKNMWDEARTNFSNKTAKSLNRVSLNDCLDAINRRIDMEDTDEPSKKTKLKAVASDVLNLLNLLGGVVAQGASMVFGPATLCFNAIQYLMDIPKMISKFYDDIHRLLSTVATFLKQFNIYQRIEEFRSLDQELRYSIHKLMITFIDICALSVEIFDGRKRTIAKHTAKLILFGNDSGIENHLDDFNRLIQQHARIENAVTLEHVMKAEHNSDSRHTQLLRYLCEQAAKTTEIQEGVGFLCEQATTQSTKIQWQKYKLKIAEKLGVIKPSQESGTDSDQLRADELQKDPYKEFQQLLGAVVPSTGSWLDELTHFRSWADARTTVDVANLLLLKGETGTGKSCVVAAMLDKLKQCYPDIDSIAKKEVSIACYNFEQLIRSTKDPADQPTLALKSVALQLAEQNFKYAKTLTNQLEKQLVSFHRSLEPKELATVLLAPFDLEDQADTKVYLVFDSLDKLTQDDRKSIWDVVLGIKSHRVRIALAGNEESFRYIASAHDHSEVIELVKHNESDLQSYVDYKLKKADCFKDQAPALTNVRSKIIENLPLIASGRFDNVDYIFNKIVAAFNDDETAEHIESLVSKQTLSSKSQDIGSEIEKLNNSLNIREIEQLNELLIWVLYAEESMSLEELNAALVLHLQKGTNLDLEKKIDRKFSAILKIESHSNIRFVSAKNDDVRRFFRETHRTTDSSRAEDGHEPTISMEIRISNVKITYARKFLWELSKKTVLENFDHFRFDESSLVTSPKRTISGNKTDSDLALVQRCFDLLSDEVEEKAKPLCRYAINNLPRHLYNLREDVTNGELHLSEREGVLQELVNLLQSPEKLDKHIDSQFLYSRTWLNEEYGIEAMKLWFSDDVVVGRLRRTEQKWIKNHSDKNAAALMSSLAALVARRWLCEETFDATDVYYWLSEYVARVQPLQNGNLREVDSKSTEIIDSMLDLAHNQEDKTEESLDLTLNIENITEWIQRNTDINTQSSLCFKRIGETYLDFDDFKEARSAFFKAEQAQDSTWEAFRGSARAFARMKDFETAITKMEIALEKLRLCNDDKKSDDDVNHLSENLVQCAEWEEKLGRYEQAIDKVRVSIELKPDSFESYEALLRLYVDADRLTEATECLRELLGGAADNEDQSNQLGKVLLVPSSWPGILSRVGIVSYVANHGNMMTSILSVVEGMLSKARGKTDDDGDVGTLMFIAGILLSCHKTDQNPLGSAMAYWKDCCEIGLNKFGYDRVEYNRHAHAIFAARHIFTHYIHEVQTGNIGAKETPAIGKTLERLVQKLHEDSNREQEMKYMMASFYTVSDQRDKARQLVMSDMKSALDLLSDDTDENDWLGYRSMWPILLHMENYLDALSAISLFRLAMGEDNDDTGFSCDGGRNCGPRSLSKGIWFCTMCENTNFCDNCLQKLKNGTLKKFICHPDHFWVKSSSLKDEYEELGKDYVRVGGTLLNGQREGGEKMLVQEWLELIKKDWNYVQPESTANA